MRLHNTLAYVPAFFTSQFYEEPPHAYPFPALDAPLIYDLEGGSYWDRLPLPGAGHLPASGVVRRQVTADWEGLETKRMAHLLRIRVHTASVHDNRAYLQRVRECIEVA
jgi:hypothetical protein